MEFEPPTTENMITRCFNAGKMRQHRDEILPWNLVTDLVRFGLDDSPDDPLDFPGDGIGILVLMCGVANWGTEDPYNLLGPDPANRGWQGTGLRSGKSFIDGGREHDWGGLGIAHFDGRGEDDDDLDDGTLEHIYANWGVPEGFTGERSAMHFNAILKSDWREEWLEWSDRLVHNLEFHVWSVRLWLSKYWTPGWRQARQAERRQNIGAVDWEWVIHSAAMWARFANSAIGAAYPHAGKAGPVVAQSYYQYKLERRGKDSADRTLRQISFTKRVLPLVKAATIQALD